MVFETEMLVFCYFLSDAFSSCRRRKIATLIPDGGIYRLCGHVSVGYVPDRSSRLFLLW